MSRRSKTKTPWLKKNLNLKVRQELIDYDYLDKLSAEEKEWLNKFTAEYIGGSFKKTESNNYSSKNLHRTKKLRKDCYDRNNKRNNDVLAVSKVTGLLKEEKKGTLFLDKTNIRTPNEIEDVIISLIEDDLGDDT